MNALIQIKSWVMHHCTWSLMTQMMMLKHYKSSLFYNSFLSFLTFCLNWKLFIFYTRGVVDSPQYAVWPLCQGHRFILDVIFLFLFFVFLLLILIFSVFCFDIVYAGNSMNLWLTSFLISFESVKHQTKMLQNLNCKMLSYAFTCRIMC
jgi:hypothetical protein